MKKPVARLVGENGNIFNLLGIASRALKEEGLSNTSAEMERRVYSEATCYNEALQIIMEYVDVE